MEEEAMKKGNLILVLATIFCLPMSCFGETVIKEGTIQGLYMVCEGQMTCSPQEEMIMAALEEHFILVSDDGEPYLLPNIRSAVLAQVFNRRVRVEGETRLQGRAIMVSKAEVLRKGKWKTFFSPEIIEKYMFHRYQPMP
jgi:hypothetical protein